MRLIEFAALFATFEESTRWTSSVRRVVPPETKLHLHRQNLQMCVVILLHYRCTLIVRFYYFILLLYIASITLDREVVRQVVLDKWFPLNCALMGIHYRGVQSEGGAVDGGSVTE